MLVAYKWYNILRMLLGLGCPDPCSVLMYAATYLEYTQLRNFAALQHFSSCGMPRVSCLGLSSIVLVCMCVCVHEI